MRWSPVMADQLSMLDTMFLELEQVDAGAHMHIGAAMVFDPRRVAARRASIRCGRTSARARAPCLASANGSPACMPDR